MTTAWMERPEGGGQFALSLFRTVALTLGRAQHDGAAGTGLREAAAVDLALRVDDPVVHPDDPEGNGHEQRAGRGAEEPLRHPLAFASAGAVSAHARQASAVGSTRAPVICCSDPWAQ